MTAGVGAKALVAGAGAGAWLDPAMQDLVSKHSKVMAKIISEELGTHRTVEPFQQVKAQWVSCGVQMTTNDE